MGIGHTEQSSTVFQGTKNTTLIMNPPHAFVPLIISSLATQRSCERKEAATFP